MQIVDVVGDKGPFAHAGYVSGMDRWVTFDCYGTLVDWTGGMLAALRPLAGDRAEALLTAYHAFEPRVEAISPHRPYREVLVEALRRAAALERLDLGAGARALVDRWGALAAFPEVPGVLAVLRQAGWRLGVLTNCDDDLFALTAPQLGLELDEVVTAEQVRSYKPRLAHFEEFRRRREPDAWVHVAASWIHDIVPASRLDLPRVWVDRDGSGHDPTLATAVIGDLSTLAATIASMPPPGSFHEVPSSG